MADKAKIELEKDEMELFKWFRQYQNVWEHAFKKCRPGSITLHFDNQNTLRKWDFHNYLTVDKK